MLIFTILSVSLSSNKLVQHVFFLIKHLLSLIYLCSCSCLCSSSLSLLVLYSIYMHVTTNCGKMKECKTIGRTVYHPLCAQNKQSVEPVMEKQLHRSTRGQTENILNQKLCRKIIKQIRNLDLKEDQQQPLDVILFFMFFIS